MYVPKPVMDMSKLRNTMLRNVMFSDSYYNIDKLRNIMFSDSLVVWLEVFICQVSILSSKSIF